MSASKRFSVPRVMTAAVLAVPVWGLVVPSAAAQDSVSADSSPALVQRTDPACHIRLEKGEAQDAPSLLLASCSGRGFSLGPADRFEVFASPAFRATVVAAGYLAQQRVFLLRTNDRGEPVVENLTGEMAFLAGRSPAAGLDGVELDYSRFASEGSLGARLAGAQMKGEAAGFRLGEHIEQVRQLEAAAAEQLTAN